MLSCTLNPKVAISYALRRASNRQLLEETFVIEYAPPCGGQCFERVTSVISEFGRLGLGKMYRDKEEEVFIPYALLPHYILGYDQFQLLGSDGEWAEYSTNFIPNPMFETNNATLDHPPRLDEEQADIMKKLNKQLAWAYHAWSGTSGEWYQVSHSKGTIAL